MMPAVFFHCIKQLPALSGSSPSSLIHFFSISTCSQKTKNRQNQQTTGGTRSVICSNGTSKSFDTEAKHFQTEQISKPLLPNIAHRGKIRLHLSFSIIFDETRNYFLMILLLEVIITSTRNIQLEYKADLFCKYCMEGLGQGKRRKKLEKQPRIPGNCKKLSESHVSAAGHHSLSPVT